MNTPSLSISSDQLDAPVVRRSDVVVVGGGPAGVSAAVAAARSGLDVTLVERYAALGGLASGGMVLVLDDMVNGDEITVTGIVDEYVERMARKKLAVYPPVEDRATSTELWNKWGRYGTFNFHSHTNPKPICYAVAFDPDAWKSTSIELVREAGVHLRMHSWFSRPIVDDGVMQGRGRRDQAGPPGDPRRCRHRHHGRHRRRLARRDAVRPRQVPRHARLPARRRRHRRRREVRAGESARGARHQPPDQAAARRRMGAVVAQDPAARRRVVQHPAHDRLRRRRPGVPDERRVSPPATASTTALEAIRADLPGFENAYVLDVAQQMGVRQTRLLQGEYVVTKEDVMQRRHFADSVARGRDYYTPYRSLLPVGVDQLLVAGRHYSATPEAQRMSREIPPCMAQGQAAGIAAALAVEKALPVRDVAGQRDPGADARPGRRPGRTSRRRRTPTIDPTIAWRAPMTTRTSRQPAEHSRASRSSTSPRSTWARLHPVARRLRRRRHQGRAARRGRPVPQLHARTRPAWTTRSSCRSTATSAASPIDTRTEPGRKVVLDLVADADVVVSNFRSGVMERLGLRLRGARARAQPAHRVGIGNRLRRPGPLRHKGGQDVIAQAYSGVMWRRELRRGTPLTRLPDHAVRLHDRHAPAARGSCMALHRPRPHRRGAEGAGHDVRLHAAHADAGGVPCS